MKVVHFLGLLAIASLASASFQGIWTDSTNYGYNTYICVDGQYLYGSYSQIGIFQGIVSVDGASVSGTWYEAGSSINAPLFGEFAFVLSKDGRSWTGVRSTNTSTTHIVWNEDLIVAAAPTEFECAKTLNRPYQGYYKQVGPNGISVDACDVNGAAAASYRGHGIYAGNLYLGYISGIIYGAHSQIFSGRYVAGNDEGVVLGFVLFNGNLGLYTWTALPSQPPNAIHYSDPTLHQTYVLIPAGTTTFDQCLENQLITFYGNSYFSNLYQPQNNISASGNASANGNSVNGNSGNGNSVNGNNSNAGMLVVSVFTIILVSLLLI